MRRNLKLLSAALLFPMAVSAQTDKIQGTIVSETDGQRLSGKVLGMFFSFIDFCIFAL